VSGSEIVDEWKGKRVSVMVAGTGPLMRGEVVRTDGVGVLLATEEMLFSPTSERGAEGVEAHEDSVPMFCFVPWTQIEVLIPRPGELP
jgi:hypothetical protein